MADFVTSDWHFNHINIMKTHDTRKHFKTKEQMNNTIISAINSVVKPEDNIYFLGDIEKGLTPEETLEILKQIKCRITLIQGNHDRDSLFKFLKKNNYQFANKDKFSFHEVGVRIKYNGKDYYLTHYPLVTGSHRPNIRNICGHIHENKPTSANILNVGIDSPELPEDLPFGTPLKLEKAIELVENKWLICYDEGDY